MTQTVVGIFQKSEDAQSARLELMRRGFQAENLDISSAENSRYSNEHAGHDEDLGDRISHFFKNLFGSEEEGQHYSRAAAGNIILTVHTLTHDESETALDVLDEYGAIDVDESAARFKEVKRENLNEESGTVEIDRTRDTDKSSDITPIIDSDTNENRGNRSRIVNKHVSESDRLREHDPDPMKEARGGRPGII